MEIHLPFSMLTNLLIHNKVDIIPQMEGPINFVSFSFSLSLKNFVHHVTTLHHGFHVHSFLAQHVNIGMHIV